MDEHPALTTAYREYLDRMFRKSRDLIFVDQFTVPTQIDIDNPRVQEWAAFG